MAEDDLKDSLDQIKGTTALAFFNEDTVKLAFDSRESNESATERDSTFKTEIYNTAKKWYQISDKIVAVMVGTRSHSLRLRFHVLGWAKQRHTNGEIYVSEAARIMESYLKRLISKKVLGKENKKKEVVYKFGAIIAGYDTSKGLQIYRVYIVGKEVKIQQIDTFASFGSGAAHANHLMVHSYNFNLSDEDAEKFAQLLVFYASFYDKSTDGNINYLEVTENGWDVKERKKALEAYSTYYEQFDEACILFLVHGNKEIIPTDDLISLFRKHGDIILSHCVDHRTTNPPENKQFYFHRLVFSSSNEAAKALASLKSNTLLDAYKSSTILSQFSYQLDWNKKMVFVQKASKQLLQYIINNSTQYLNKNPKN